MRQKRGTEGYGPYDRIVLTKDSSVTEGQNNPNEDIESDFVTCNEFVADCASGTSEDNVSRDGLRLDFNLSTGHIPHMVKCR